MAIREGKVVSRSDGAHDAQRGLHIFHMRTTGTLTYIIICLRCAVCGAYASCEPATHRTPLGCTEICRLYCVHTALACKALGNSYSRRTRTADPSETAHLCTPSPRPRYSFTISTQSAQTLPSRYELCAPPLHRHSTRARRQGGGTPRRRLGTRLRPYARPIR